MVNPALLLPHHQKKSDLMILGSSAPCCLTWSHVFRRFLEEPPTCILRPKKNMGKHHSSHHHNLKQSSLRDVRKNESWLGLFVPEELEAIFDTACAHRDQFEEM